MAEGLIRDWEERIELIIIIIFVKVIVIIIIAGEEI